MGKHVIYPAGYTKVLIKSLARSSIKNIRFYIVKISNSIDPWIFFISNLQKGKLPYEKKNIYLMIF